MKEDNKLSNWDEIKQKLKSSYKTFNELRDDCKRVISCDFIMSYRKGICMIYLEDSKQISKDSVIYKKIGNKIRMIDTEKFMKGLYDVLDSFSEPGDLLFILEELDDLEPENMKKLYKETAVKILERVK